MLCDNASTDGSVEAIRTWARGGASPSIPRSAALARRFDAPNPVEERALKQAARELLLAQSSDWAFIMKTNTTVEYAKKRTRDHIARFTWLYKALCEGTLDPVIVADFEGRDNIFPDVDYRVYR